MAEVGLQPLMTIGIDPADIVTRHKQRLPAEPLGSVPLQILLVTESRAKEVDLNPAITAPQIERALNVLLQLAQFFHEGGDIAERELGSEDEVALIGVDYVCAIAGIDIVAGEPSST